MSNLNNILDELYAIEPSLKSNPDVPKIVVTLLAARPVVAVDEAFRMQLRQRLLQRSEPVRTARPVSMFKQPWLYAVPVAVIAAIFIFPKLRPGGNPVPGPGNGPAVTVQSTGDRAFGVLSTATLTAESTATRQAAAATDSTTATPPTVAPSSLLVKPDVLTYYKYVYSGPALQLANAQLNVFERQPGAELVATSNVLNAIDLGTLDLQTFGSMNVQNITLTQPDGFTLNISQPDGSISLYRAQTSFIRPAAGETGAIPDDEAIKIATDFLGQHGIDVSLYGQPKVQPSYAVPAFGRAVLETTDLKESIAATPMTQVVFPVVIDGVASFGLWGDPIGMTVDVDTANRQVMSVYNLTSRRYISSAYPAVTDAATILNVAARGGVYGSTYPAETAVTEVKLGEPERVLTQMYRYDAGRSRDLLVPALRFPVIDRTAAMPSAIVVPLIKDLLAVDTPVIEPLIIDDDGANSSSGSSSGSEPALINGASPERD
ncbi:MAG: hypothetical protein HY976_00140 [Candidatus Kerfeldbacteria bacterium]|nr:hypothetical protein [Candidatus Kerfeldbacteria bacterium]